MADKAIEQLWDDLRHHVAEVTQDHQKAFVLWETEGEGRGGEGRGGEGRGGEGE